MSNKDSTPLQYLAAYAITFAAGALASAVLCAYGHIMRKAGRREG